MANIISVGIDWMSFIVVVIVHILHNHNMTWLPPSEQSLLFYTLKYICDLILYFQGCGATVQHAIGCFILGPATWSCFEHEGQYTPLGMFPIDFMIYFYANINFLKHSIC